MHILVSEKEKSIAINTLKGDNNSNFEEVMPPEKLLARRDHPEQTLCSVHILGSEKGATSLQASKLRWRLFLGCYFIFVFVCMFVCVRLEAFAGLPSANKASLMFTHVLL